MKVLVVGGGTAGLVAASLLKRRFDWQVDVVHSPSIGIIGVGEGSTEHWADYLAYMQINPYYVIKRTDATFKAGVMFEGWTPNPYFHNVSGDLNVRAGQVLYAYATLLDNNVPISLKPYWENKVDRFYINKPENVPFNQYHFNTFKLNDFLQEVCEAYGVGIFEDEIVDISLKTNGDIGRVRGEKRDYNYDFYIDSTGFKRILMNKLGAKWVSHSQYLRMNSAITFPTADTDEYNMWTLASAMDYGWRFRIPTWGRHGNGYIYDSSYINEDQAVEEAQKHFDEEISVAKSFKFDPGHVDRAWIKNCVAVGVSSSFIEPLEATSIGSSIQQVFLLMQYLGNYSDKDIEAYNKGFTDIMQNIRDFVYLHYMVKKNNTAFWKDIQDLPVPDSLSEKLDKWKTRLPIDEDFVGESSYTMFGSANYLTVLDGLGMINRKAVKNTVKDLPEFVRSVAYDIMNRKIEMDKAENFMSHKKFIELIREYL